MTGRAQKAAALAIAFAGVLATEAASAATVEASSTTLLAGRPDLRLGEVHTALPIVEQVGLSASNFDLPVVDDLKLRVSGWGRLDAADTKALAGDFEIAFLQGRLLSRRLTLSLGRHVVTGGAARFTHLDGASADLRIGGGIGFAAYGGAPVIPRFARAQGDAIYGGRLYWRGSMESEVGASFVQVLDHGRTARMDAGLDARVRVMNGLSFGGFGLWSLAESRLAEVDVGPTWVVNEKLQARLQYRRTAPDLFLPRSSIFSVFAEMQRDEVGGDVSYQVNPYTGLFADYHSVWPGGGRGDDATLRATFRSDPSSTAVFGGQVRLLRMPTSGYVEGRLFGSYRPMDKLTVALDLDGYQFLEDIAGYPGIRTTFTAALTGAYQFLPGWLAVLSGTGGTTVQMQSRFELLAKLVYNFPTTTSGRTP